MSPITGVCMTICCVCASAGVLSALIPQKRTAKIMSFVIGVFMIASVLGVVTEADIGSLISVSGIEEYEIPSGGEDDYTDAVARLTAENVTEELNELLINEGIKADDIQLILKISDEGRIYASRVVIYINVSYADRKEEIKSMVYRTVSKEPEIYVTGQDDQQDTQ